MIEIILSVIAVIIFLILVLPIIAFLFIYLMENLLAPFLDWYFEKLEKIWRLIWKTLKLD